MQTANRYFDRVNAGQALAAELQELAARDDTLVLGLPRGGVPVAAEVARALAAPLDIFPVRKIGAPSQPEFAIGAVAAGGIQVLDEGLVREFAIPKGELEQLIEGPQHLLAEQERLYRGHRPAATIAGKTVVLVDDGAATGYTLVAAAAGVRRQNPERVVIAVPVASAEACAPLEEMADELVCPLRPTPFHAVGLWYVHFETVEEEEAVEQLVCANRRMS